MGIRSLSAVRGGGCGGASARAAPSRRRGPAAPVLTALEQLGAALVRAGVAAAERTRLGRFDNMTTYDYLMVMKSIKIAQLKSELSRHLRDVRRGEPLTVLDRMTPVARLVPIDAGDDVVITVPTPGTTAPGKVRLPAPLRVGADIVTLLLAERQNHR